MCGIAGIITNHSEPLEPSIQHLSESLKHRGPDACGTWISQDQKVSLTHRRLSILDLSDEASQPMISSSGKHVLIYNGEIYNYKELQHELYPDKDLSWGDTRTLLECIEQWGISRTVEKLQGMYTFALFDQEQNTLHLHRDSLGIKPLYYGHHQNRFFFSSEFHELMSLIPNAKLCKRGLTDLLGYSTITPPQTISEHIFKCHPGEWITINTSSLDIHKQRLKPIAHSITKGLSSQSQAPYQDQKEQLKESLERSVQQHMVSDVPIGCFLSGGIDSTLITAIAQKLSTQPIKTFTIGMEEESYNEAKYAKQIAAHLGTEHHEHYLSPQLMAEAVPSILDQLDEPFADSSLIPTYHVCQMTRQHVKVALSGDGGDELFCGYTRYKWSRQIWNKINPIPQGLRQALSSLIKMTPPPFWETLFSILTPLLPQRFQETHLPHKLQRLAQLLPSQTPKDLYQHLITHTASPQNFLIDCPHQLSVPSHPLWDDLKTLEEQMMANDLLHYLPDDILTKVDRASMMVSLEARVPFLTPTMVQQAWSMPLEHKLDKKILKDLLAEFLPKEHILRPKMGFGIAFGQWLQGSLKAWAENLIQVHRNSKDKVFNQMTLDQLWQEHQSQRRNHEYMLWNHLVFLHWWQKHHH